MPYGERPTNSSVRLGSWPHTIKNAASAKSSTASKTDASDAITTTACSCRKSDPNIVMVSSTENWFWENAPGGLNSPRYRRILVQREMCPSAIVILHIREEYVAQMPFAEDHNMIKAFLSDRSNQPFAISILPRRSWRYRPVTNAHGVKPPFEYLAIDAISISNEILRLNRPEFVGGHFV